jgi:hypothetical protein
MFKGYDTTDPITQATVDAMVGAGMTFAIKYTADSQTYGDKRFSHVEAALLHAAGMKLGFVFEKQDDAAYFTAGQGTEDAEEALTYFSELGVPAGVACFYAIDFDALTEDIRDYATAFHARFEGSGYLTGCYGCGDILETLKDEGLCHFTWLANAAAWGGYFDWLGKEDILQYTGSVLGLASDPDEAVNLDWAW